jgi:beta-lactamase superfamily II metal-dependent hydrolase
MLKLQIIQAEYGDCFIIEYGIPSDPSYALIDGGPENIYNNHLRSKLQKIKDSGGNLDLVIVSHVDNDHVIGLLDLMAEIREQRSNEKPETISIKELWYNSFAQTIGRDNDIESRLNILLANANIASYNMTATNMAIKGIAEGHKLRLAAMNIDIPINSEFDSGLITVDDVVETITLDNLRIHIVGPSKQNLQDLRNKWFEWLDKYEGVIMEGGDPSLAAMADRSIPNLSSIMIMIEAHDKTILLTGDGRGDHLLQGLDQTNLLNAEGNLHVDILKVPHHGSERNVTRKFFKAITADKYIISANGKDNNPDLSTLIWIVEAAREKQRTIEIIVTNETPTTQKLLQDYNPTEYGYKLTVMEKGSHFMTLDIAS